MYNNAPELNYQHNQARQTLSNNNNNNTDSHRSVYQAGFLSNSSSRTQLAYDTIYPILPQSHITRPKALPVIPNKNYELSRLDCFALQPLPPIDTSISKLGQKHSKLPVDKANRADVDFEKFRKDRRRTLIVISLITILFCVSLVTGIVLSLFSKYICKP